MGYRMYACKLYRVERDREKGGYFNHLSENINRMFKEECEDVEWDGGENIEYAETIFVPKDQMAKLIGKFADPEAGGEMILRYDLNPDEYTHLDMVKMLADFLSAADSKNDFVALQWV